VSLRVSFELDDDDLKHFRLIMRASRKTVARSSPEDIIANANALLSKIGPAKVSRFIRERLDKLSVMILMLTDHEWRLPHKDTNRVLNALAYFAEPEDLIPDHIPGLGFLDDAIMIELVVRELKHEIEAYGDFCNFRDDREPQRRMKTSSTDMSREKWLDGHREKLQSRMRRRRKRSKEKAGGGAPLL